MKKTNYKIDIIIPTYNGERHLPGLLDCLERQSHGGYNCIVIDDCSRDNTVQVVKRRYPWVNLIEREKNHGPAANRNVAARAGQAPYIVIFDDDVYIEDPDWLAKAHGIMEKNPRIGQLATKIIWGMDKSILLDCGIEECNYRFHGIFFRQPLSGVKNRHLNSRKVLGACSAGTIVRRDVFEMVGGFSPYYFYPAEDLDLSLRIHLAGYDVVYEPSMETFHFESQAMGKSIRRKHYMYRRNCLLAIFENYPISHAIRVLASFMIKTVNPLGVLMPSIFGAPMSIRERLDYIRSYFFLLSNCKRIHYKRRMVDRFKKRPRRYLMELNKDLKKELYC